MKRGIILVFALVFLLSAINIASAEIMISQTKAVYNVNDDIDVNAVVKTTSSIDDFIEFKLACGDSNKMFYFSPISLNAGQEEKIDKKLLLSNSFLAGMRGNCMITAKYGFDAYSSQIFRISDKINLVVNADKTSVEPDEKIIIKGTALKENGNTAEGFVEASVDNTIMKFSDSVTQGKINFNLSFPDNAKSGNYRLKIKVYEKVNEEISNFGENEIFLNVKQEPRRLEIALDKQEVIPGESINIRPVVYDQADDEIGSEVKIDITDEKGIVFLSKIIDSGTEEEISFAESTSPGSWNLKASALGLSSERGFNIAQLEKASFDLANDTLTITNIGNVIYTKAVQVNIGGEVRVIETNLDVGESKILRLTGEGVFDVSVSDGKGNLFVSGVPLVGGAIGIKEIKGELGVFNKYPIIWLFLIAIFGVFIMTMSTRVIKKRFYGYAPKEDKSKDNRIGGGVEKIDRKDVGKEMLPINALKRVREAEHSLVLQGNKEDAGIVVLKLKNQNALGNNKLAMETINQAVGIINENKGTINKTADGYTGIFTASTTKTFKNDLAAIKTASAIASHLNEHNKRFKDKIEYGVGINSGEIVVKIEQGKLKFTPLGNTVNLARRVADSADKTVLLTGNVNKKVSNEVKTLKQGEFYSISRIVERETNKDFLNKFKERNKFQ